MMTKTYTWEKIYWKNREVGKLRSDGLVYQTIRTPAHIYRKKQAFGFSTGLIRMLEKKTFYNLKQIRIVYIDKEKGENAYWRFSLEWLKREAEIEEINNDKQYLIKVSKIRKLNEVE